MLYPYPSENINVLIMIRFFAVMLLVVTFSVHAAINPLFIHGDQYNMDDIQAFLDSDQYPPGHYILPAFLNGEFSGNLRLQIEVDGRVCKDMSMFELVLDGQPVVGMDCGEFDKNTGSVFSLDKDKEIANYRVMQLYLPNQYDANYVQNSIKKHMVNSVYANYNVSAVNNSADLQSYYGSFSVDGNVQDVSFNSSANVTEQGLEYGNIYIAKPWYENGAQIMFGDFGASVGHFTPGNIGVRGLSIATDPSLSARDGGRNLYVGMVSEPSDIFLYQRDQLITRFFVNAGEYSLKEALAQTSVYGDVTIVEKGISGAEQKKQLYLPYTQNLLNIGEARFSLLMGKLNPRVYPLDTNILSADYKYGFSTISPGISLSYLDTGYYHYGLGANVYMGRQSELEATISGSSYQGQSGQRVGLSFYTNFNQSPFKLGFALASFEDGYMGIDDYVPFVQTGGVLGERLTSAVNLQYSKDPGFLNGVYLSYNVARYSLETVLNSNRKNTNSYTLGLNGNLRQSSRTLAYWNLSASKQTNGDGLSAVLSLSIPFQKTETPLIDSINLSVIKNPQTTGYSAFTSLSERIAGVNYYANLSNQENNNSVGLDFSPYGKTSVSMSLANNYSRLDVKGSAALTHASGLDLQAQTLTNPILIKAKGFEGTRQLGAVIGADGYAVAESNGSPYNKIHWRLDATQADSDVLVINDRVSHTLPRGVMTKVYFSTLQRQYYYITLNRAGKPVGLGSLVRINDKSFYTQTNGGLMFHVQPETNNIIMRLKDGSQCLATMSTHHAGKASNRIPDLGSINCE
jgi:hypothetical protein